MLVCMRTSMNLPDGLLEEAKARAAAEGSTVTQLVIEGLRHRIAAPDQGVSTRVALPSRSLGRARVDLSDNRAVREILDDEADLGRHDPR